MHPTEPTSPELEGAIRFAPEATEAYLVYSDWYAERGHPRGELIALDHQIESGGDETLRGARRRLLAGAHDALLGPIEDWGRPVWRLGFVRSLAIDMGYYERHKTNEEASQVVRKMLLHPSCRFLRSLRIGDVWGGDVGHLDYEGIVAALAEVEASILESLSIGPTEYQLSWSTLGDVSAIYAAHPGLRSLELRSGHVDLGETVRLPELERFVIQTTGLRREVVEALGRSKWPKLRRLDLWLGAADRGAEVTPGDLAPILSGEVTPSLRRLGLMNAEISDELCDALAGAPILRRLAHLDLSMGTMTDEGARRLAAASNALAHLDVLDVSENCLSPEGVATLEALEIQVVSGGQKEEDWRYASVSE